MAPPMATPTATKYPWSEDTLAERMNAVRQLLDRNDASVQHVFTQLFAHAPKHNIPTANAPKSKGPLAGAILSVKDLFDVTGYITKAGTQFMSRDAAATQDAEAIKQLRDAGATLIGHTNMTELAYSGLGLNPHYGTPENALLPGHIPGGSTSGGAVSVAKGFSDIAIGTDTGGSLRIPAAFNGIVGFKPTQSTVSRRGCKNLSQSLDSIGPMARSVEACELAYRAMSKSSALQQCNIKPSFVIPSNFGLTELDATVSNGFDSAVRAITSAGFDVVEQNMESLDALKLLPIWHFAAVECRNEYDQAYLNQASEFDPRVHSRMSRADEVSKTSYEGTLKERARLIDLHQSELKNNILLLPTVPIMPPMFSDLDSDEEYYRINLLTLRNPTIANVMDCCSVSLPYATEGGSIGIMLNAVAGSDYQLLDTAKLVRDIITSEH